MIVIDDRSVEKCDIFPSTHTLNEKTTSRIGLNFSCSLYVLHLAHQNRMIAVPKDKNNFNLNISVWFKLLII